MFCCIIYNLSLYPLSLDSSLLYGFIRLYMYRILQSTHSHSFGCSLILSSQTDSLAFLQTLTVTLDEMQTTKQKSHQHSYCSNELDRHATL